MSIREAVKLLTGFTDEELDDLGGFPEDGEDDEALPI
jgi:hypothetical protein